MVDEIRALEHNPSSFYNASAAAPKSKKKKGLLKKGGAALGIFAALGFGLIAVFFNAGEVVPDMVKTDLVNATDVQCANGTIDKEWAFIEALSNGDAPSDTATNLKNAGFPIGYLDENNQFVESLNGNVLKSGDNYLSGDNLFSAFQTNSKLYDAFNNATYSCTAFYYDEAAEKTFEEIGVSRNTAYSEDGFDETLATVIEGTSDISVNNVTKTTKQTTDGDTETIYSATGDNISTKTSSAEELVNDVRSENAASTETESALNAADTLKVADTLTKEQRSSRLFVYFMQNIDKMKAGAGDSSNIHDVMNYLTTARETEVVDVATGEIIKQRSTPMDSPALNSVLSGKPIDVEKSKNYSSDRILQTVENQLDLDTAEIATVKNPIASAISSTVSSFSKSSGIITRFLSNGIQTVELSVLAPIIPTISSSLIKNQAAVYGVTGGEMLVEGAVNVGRKLAMQGSGATASDGAAAIAYNKQVQQIAALNAEVERANRSPFDITSKYTFLGSIVHQILPVITESSSIPTFMVSTIASLSPNTYAEGESELLTSFGSCETYATIGAVGTAHCSLVASFDTSTSHDPYNNQSYLDFVDQNTYLDESGNRQVKDGSYLANFIIYNNNRVNPFGTTDASILAAIKNHFGFLEFLNDPAIAISLYDEASDEEKALATGAAFVNSASNPYWNEYKYAQRYVSVNRAVSVLKAYSTDQTAYQNLPGCEGTINSVVAYENKYFAEHPKNTFTDIAIIETKELPTESLDTSDDHLVVSEVLDQAPTTNVVELGKYIIKQNDWTLA